MYTALKASIRYIEASRASVSDAEEMQRIIDGQATHVRMLISRAKPNIDDATQALELLGQGDAPFNEDQKKTLRASLTTKISTGESEPAAKDGSKSQSNLYVYKYLTASTWDALCDKNKSDEDRCAVMVEAMRNIGLVYGQDSQTHHGYSDSGSRRK